ncbi:hypothetical protein AVEN_176371-1 [Araneus ventricosus]|uniref:Uncharacterized protein n=1 Tax=Araneus ventricosus TaxID=182803 RepID=A0A4Y2C6X2_ARAVE|nr:hypothetical protein AVEN_176371-1 [Araneus ventricosus]
MALGIAFIIGFRNTPIEAGLSCTFAASTCCRTLRRCSCISLNTPYKNFPRRGAWPPVAHSGATPDSTTKDYTNGKYCWKVWIHPNPYSRLVQEPWIELPCNGRRPLPEISTDGCQNWNHRPLDLDGAPSKFSDLAGPKSVEEPHTGWSGFMKNVAGKEMI